MSDKYATIEDIENALDALLYAIDHYRSPKPVANRLGRTAWSAGELLAAFPEELDLLDVVTSPVKNACRKSVRNLGRHLFRRLGSTEAMKEVLERVALRDERRYSARASLMDHAWDGLGGDGDHWFS